jgi:hypothetical protein
MAAPPWAFTTNRNAGGVAPTQPAIADGLGRRRNVAFSSTVEKRVA